MGLYRIQVEYILETLSQLFNHKIRCVAKNSLGHSDGSITLYGEKENFFQIFPACILEVAAPTLATTATITAVSAIEEESTIGTKRQRQRGTND